MRVELKGEGEPIPTIALPHESEEVLVPPLALFLTNGVPFVKSLYTDQGYTRFEVWCVGATGGLAAPYLDSANMRTAYGGGGGGGGLHRVEGDLADLPAESAVVVGVAGADGVYDPNNPSTQVPGQDGGFSSFAGAVCRASGGRGGGAPYGRVIPPYGNQGVMGGDGGQGGAGNRTGVGGGAAGGVYYTQVQGGDWVPTSIAAAKGTWDGNIGQGGGGGEGGYHRPYRTSGGIGTPEEWRPSGSGGHGSYSFVDTSMYGAGQAPLNNSQSRPVIPGGGGGARLNTLYGYGSKTTTYSPHGAVYIRLT